MKTVKRIEMITDEQEMDKSLEQLDQIGVPVSALSSLIVKLNATKLMS